MKQFFERWGWLLSILATMLATGLIVFTRSQIQSVIGEQLREYATKEAFKDWTAQRAVWAESVESRLAALAAKLDEGNRAILARMDGYVQSSARVEAQIAVLKELLEDHKRQTTVMMQGMPGVSTTRP